MRNKLAFLAVPLIALLLSGCAGDAYAQVAIGLDDPTPVPIPVEKVDFETKYPQPVSIGPPPPTADIWAFDSVTIDPADGSITAVLVLSLTQDPVPPANGLPGFTPEPKRQATFTVHATAEEAAGILGKDVYLALMTDMANAVHAIAKAHNQEPK